MHTGIDQKDKKKEGGEVKDIKAELPQCEHLEDHRLYHAMKTMCPCLKKWIYVPQIPVQVTPTIRLDDVEKRRWNIIG